MAWRLPIPWRLADDKKQMSARKLIYRLMVVAPALFLIGIGVHARTMERDFERLANDPRTESHIQAYAPLLLETRTVSQDDVRHRPGRLRQIAERWIDGARDGHLRPLRPIAYEDTSTEGVKAQVFEAQGRLVALLTLAIDRDLAAHRPSDAARDAITAMETANTLKYSDFLSLYNCANQQRHILIRVQKLLPDLPPVDRARLLEATRTMIAEPKVLDGMANQSRVLFLSWRDRQGYPNLAIEDTRLLSEIPAMIESDDPLTLQAIRRRVVASNDDFVPTYYSALRLGIEAQRELEISVKAGK